MSKAKFAKEAAENLQPEYYGSTTRFLMDRWHLNRYAQRSEEEVEEASEHLTKSQKRQIKKRMKYLIKKAKATGVK